MWSAAITSVVGAAYTSVSFLKTFHARLESNDKWLTIAFIVFSTVVFLFVGQPVKVLILAGTFNGFVLPVGLALILLASRKQKIVGDYRHPLVLQIAGWLVVLIMLVFSAQTVVANLSK
jgi:Mn2+/Fe2+ NRAMP family transporter